MPNRILKESIRTSETLNQLSRNAEWFFFRLLVSADDYGRFDGRLRVIKSTCFPLLPDADMPLPLVQSMVEELEEVGIIARYDVAGEPYLVFVAWEKHQKIRAKRAKYPAPPSHLLAASEGDNPTERHIEDIIFANIKADDSFCGHPLVKIDRQVRTADSYADLKVITTAQQTVVELKRTRLSNKAIGQLERYLQVLGGEGLLIGFGVTGSFDLAWCRQLGMAVISLDEELRPTIILEQPWLTDCGFLRYDGKSRGNATDERQIPTLPESNPNPNPIQRQSESESRINKAVARAAARGSGEEVR